jgi:lysophospholipase L1-like esterase
MTWWMQVINKMGGTLFVNNSYSGTCVADGSSNATKNMSRLEYTTISGETPDVILIYMGSNDCASASVTQSAFDSGYSQMLDNLKVLCPNSEIILLTLCSSPFYSASEQQAYNNIIKTKAKDYNLKVVDISTASLSGHLVDSAHPAYSGMQVVANKVIEGLNKIA